jgi:hypothetical protein
VILRVGPKNDGVKEYFRILHKLQDLCRSPNIDTTEKYKNLRWTEKEARLWETDIYIQNFGKETY